LTPGKPGLKRGVKRFLSSLEEQLGRAIGELQVIDRFISELQSRVNTLRALLVEYESAMSFIEELKKSGEKMRLLVPIGGGNYVHAEITDVRNMEVSIGAGVVMTKTVEESAEIMQRRRENLLRAVEEYESQIAQYSQRALELKRLVDALAAKLKEREGEEKSGSKGP